MKVYRHIDEFLKLKNAVVTIGTFDGVHFGHQKIINRLTEVAERCGGESVILTFFPHPRMILHPENNKLKLITTIDEKAELIEKLGVDHLIITPFTRDFSNLSAETYIKQILVDKIGTKKLIIGFDHRFGKDRQGNLEELQKYASQYHYEVEEITEQDIHEVKVSSTQIRESLIAGDAETAEDFLSYPFFLTGKVIKGDRLGRQMGFPTANLHVEETYKLIPSDGIYAVEVELLEKQHHYPIDQPLVTSPKISSSNLFKGMAYIGNRPTINGMSRNIEVNIFEFDRDIYRQYIRIHFKNFVREDMRFNSLDELKEQIAKDKLAVLKLLS